MHNTAREKVREIDFAPAWWLQPPSDAWRASHELWYCSANRLRLNPPDASASPPVSCRIVVDQPTGALSSSKMRCMTSKCRLKESQTKVPGYRPAANSVQQCWAAPRTHAAVKQDSDPDVGCEHQMLRRAAGESTRRLQHARRAGTAPAG